ncbi:MAG: hypothetical protein EOO65_01745, partial [Methanosarcinales archaeon]
MACHGPPQRRAQLPRLECGAGARCELVCARPLQSGAGAGAPAREIRATARPRPPYGNRGQLSITGADTTVGTPTVLSLLVCAPSNKAVQVVAHRFLKEQPDVPMVMVGVESKIANDLLPIASSNWQQRYAKKLLAVAQKFMVTPYLPPDLRTSCATAAVGAAQDDTSDAQLVLGKTPRLWYSPTDLHPVDDAISEAADSWNELANELVDIVRVCGRYLTQPEIASFISMVNSWMPGTSASPARASAGSGASSSSAHTTRAHALAEATRAALNRFITALRSLRSGAEEFPSLSDTATAVRRIKTARSTPITPEQRASLNAIACDIAKLVEFATCMFKPLQTEDQLLMRAHVVFCTLSIAGRRSLGFHGVFNGIRTVIIDEAGQAVEPEAMLALQLACDASKCLLAGDVKQLPATVIADSARTTLYERSLLERLTATSEVAAHFMLREQYRMRAAIRAFPSRLLYNDALVDAPSIASRPLATPHHFEAHGHQLFLDVKGREEGFENSYYNFEEAAAVAVLLEAIMQHDTVSTIGIICFYGRQTEVLRRVLTEHNVLSDRITISTVDGFQGDERDIIIVCSTRANPHNRIGFLRDFRRLNVAITRARDLMLWVGHERTLSACKNTELLEFMSHVRKQRQVWPVEHMVEVRRRSSAVRGAAAAASS